MFYSLFSSFVRVEIGDDDGIIEEESTLEEEEERPKSSILNRPTILPQWYREGNYERNPTRTREPLIIDETHDKKKGNKTDYVKRQGCMSTLLEHMN